MSSKFSNWVAPTSRRPSGTYTTTCQATWTTVSIVLSLLTYLLMLMKRGWVAGCGHQDKQWCRELAQPAQSTGVQGQAWFVSACNPAIPRGGLRFCPVCPGIWMPSPSGPRYNRVQGRLDKYWTAYSAGELTTSALLKKCSYVYGPTR